MIPNWKLELLAREPRADRATPRPVVQIPIQPWSRPMVYVERDAWRRRAEYAEGQVDRLLQQIQRYSSRDLLTGLSVGCVVGLFFGWWVR